MGNQLSEIRSSEREVETVCARQADQIVMLESIEEMRRKRSKEMETAGVDGSSGGREAVAGWAKYGVILWTFREVRASWSIEFSKRSRIGRFHRTL